MYSIMKNNRQELTFKRLPVGWHALAIVLASVMFWNESVSAHSVELLKSEPEAGSVVPQAPRQVKAWFNEEMQTGASYIQVLNDRGEQIDLGDGGVDLTDAQHASMVVSLPDVLPEGLYTVHWYVMLLDNDPTEGEFYFYVGDQETGAARLASLLLEQQDTQPELKANEFNPAFLYILGGIGGLLVVVAVLVFSSRRTTSASRQ